MARTRTHHERLETILLAVLLSLACCLALTPPALAEGDADTIEVVEPTGAEESIEVAQPTGAEGLAEDLNSGSDQGAITVEGTAEPADSVALDAVASNIATGTWGTCPWVIDADGVLTVYPGTGASTIYMDEWDGERFICPWARWASSVKKARFVADGGEMVVAPRYCPYLFSGFDNMTEVDFSGFDTSGGVSYAENMFGAALLDTFIAGDNYVVTSREMVPRSSAVGERWYSASESGWLTREEILQRGVMTGIYGSSYGHAIDPNNPHDPTNPFIDVSETTAHYEDILWLADTGISAGWDMPDGTKEYRPNNNVARADMAAFLFRLAKMWGVLEASDNWAPKAATRARFTDVNDKTSHAREVWWLAENGISEGWDVGGGKKEFRPYASIARSDFAAFVERLCRKAARKGITEVDKKAFADVSERVAHCGEIWWMAANGISKGWDMPDGTKEFRPFRNVARNDMAAFLHRVRAEVDQAYMDLYKLANAAQYKVDTAKIFKRIADEQVSSANEALAQAKSDEAAKKAAYDQAEAAAKAARQAEGAASSTLDARNNETAAAKDALDSAKSSLATAQRNAQQAQQAKEQADAAVATAQANLTAKQQDLVAAQEELAAAQEAQAQVFSGGSVTFFEAQGNTRAAGYLTDQTTMESGGTTFYSHTTIGGPYDATNIDNMLMALDWLDYCNETRQQLAQMLGTTLDPYLVTDELMASAQRNANFSTDIYRHANKPGGGMAMADETGSGRIAENLFVTPIGKQSAYEGWLWDEKSTWDELVSQNSTLSKYWLDINGLKSYYASIGKEAPNVGHYFALANPIFRYTGLGLNSSTRSQTGHNGAAVQQFRAGTNATSYTVAEYRQRLQAYRDSLMNDGTIAAQVASAEAAVNVASAAVDAASSTLDDARSAATRAQQALTSANAALTSAQTTRDAKQAAYDTAKAASDAAQSAWEAAAADATAKEAAATKAKQAYDAAKQATTQATEVVAGVQAAANTTADELKAAESELAAVLADLENYVA